MLWAQYHWNPQTSLAVFAAQYASYFVSEPIAALLAEGLLLLEENWDAERGRPLDTLSLFQKIEALQSPKDLQKYALPVEKATALCDVSFAHRGLGVDSWRLQMYLYRAYYDAYQYLRYRLYVLCLRCQWFDGA